MNDNDLQRLRQALLSHSGQRNISFWGLLSNQGHEIELALLYGKAFWPELVQVEGYVLLAEHYDEGYFERILRDVGSEQLEATINTAYLRNIFGDQDADDALWEALGHLLAQTWKSCAEAKFPGRTFRSEFSWYSEIGDPGITLFQEPT